MNPQLIRLAVNLLANEKSRGYIKGLIAFLIFIPIFFTMLTSLIAPDLDFSSKDKLITPIISDDYIVSQEYAVTNGGELGYITHKGIDYAQSGEVAIMNLYDGYVTNVVNSCREGDRWCGGGFGNHVMVTTTIGEVTNNIYYAHLEYATVESGSKIKIFEPIGYMGNTGNSTGKHLHFEVRQNNISMDPNGLLNYVNEQFIEYSAELSCLNDKDVDCSNMFFTKENTYIENTFAMSKVNIEEEESEN